MDEPTGPVAAEDVAEPRRVRRRRSSSRSRRSKRVQGRIPFTSLRFMRPRLPTLGQIIGLTFALVALGLSVWTIQIAGRASLTLDQTRSLLSENTHAAAAGRMAADRLAAEAQADTAQMMAAQDSAARAAARASTGLGFGFGSPYAQGPQPSGAEAAGGAASAGYGQAYGPMPYGSPSYGPAPYGAQQPGAAPPASGANVMGYTLPSNPR